MNVGHDARKRMKELKQDGSIHVNEFSNLMLQISNMRKDDPFFNFMDELKPWAAQEIWQVEAMGCPRNQVSCVKDVSTAMTVAKTLVEYRSSERELSKQKGCPYQLEQGVRKGDDIY